MKIAVMVCAVTLLAPIAWAQDEENLINADRPGLADSSATVSRGVFQIEFGLERDDDAGSHVTSTPLLLRYGIADRFELRVETSGLERTSGSGSEWGPTALGFKYHFAGKRDVGLIGSVDDEGAADLRLVADVDLSDRWSINPNLGATSDKEALGALTVQYDITPKVNAFVDGAVTVPTSGGSSSLLLDAG